MEQNDSQQPIRPLFSSPGMKIWLLIALNFACYGILILLTRFEIFSWITATPETATPTTGKISIGFQTLVIFLLPALVFANAVVPEGFSFYKLHRKVKVVPMILAAFAILASIFFIDILGQWNASLITNPEAIADNASREVYSTWVTQMSDIGELFIFLITSALIPAVVEELFFRGGVMQLLVGALKKHHAAILLSAFFFSLMHMDMYGFAQRFVLGVALGYLFWWSGSLRLSILAHFVFNAFNIINAYFVQHYPESWWAKAETTYTLGAISLVVSVGALLTCRNLLKQNAQRA